MTIVTDVSTAVLKVRAPGADAVRASRMLATSRAGCRIRGDALPPWRLVRQGEICFPRRLVGWWGRECSRHAFRQIPIRSGRPRRL